MNDTKKNIPIVELIPSQDRDTSYESTKNYVRSITNLDSDQLANIISDFSESLSKSLEYIPKSLGDGDFKLKAITVSASVERSSSGGIQLAIFASGQKGDSATFEFMFELDKKT